METISRGDREILRALAAHQYKLSQSERNLKCISDWYRHNAFEPGLPIVHIELNTFEQEIIPKRLRCEGKAARAAEAELYRQFLNLELFDDDWPVRDYFPVILEKEFIPFGLPVRREESGGVGHHFVSQIEDLEADRGKLGKSPFCIKPEVTAAKKVFYEEIFGDILPVREEADPFYACLTQDLVHIMAMEDMFVAMMDYPEDFAEILSNLADDYIALFTEQEQKGLLLPTTGHSFVGNGTRAFTRELPELPLKTTDCWGFMDSQETVGISPAMFEELIFPAYRKVLDTYGAISYGCCEPVHPIWDSCLSKLERLRKVSVSPWCDEEFMGERLRGRRTVYHRKPSPNFLGVDKVFDEDAYRAHVTKTLTAARGCTLEFSMRDIYTLHGDEGRARRAVEIVREAAENCWK